MKEINGVVYANSPVPELIRVKFVKPLEDYKLLLTFTNGKQKIFDMSEMLDQGVYSQLKDKTLFNKAYVSHGTVEWNEDLDIDPDTLYEKSTNVDLTKVSV